ncbi:recombination protein F [Rubripirellula lacrimiformis]|uniref:Recombination protein F n=1 Tax=Rubripirellula lacrimiformis TaxID=1930273 RepID=A0A517N5A4_9BACT|nr:ATP-binding protein [Rubripirellula lacrimiformis]QDT02208.1 recombination protein F [Rubripirellula lacrimiformis]
MENEKKLTRPHIRELRLRRFRGFENARLVLNDFTVIVGRNGAGKSTLMEAIDFVQDAVTHSVLTALERRGGINSILHRPSSSGDIPESVETVEGTKRSVGKDLEIAIDLQIPLTPTTHTNVLYGFTLSPYRGRSGFQVKREYLRTYPKESFSFYREGRTFNSEIRSAKPSVHRESLVLPLVAGEEDVWQMTLDVLRRMLVYDLSPQIMQSEPRIGSQESLARDGSNLGDVLRRLDDDKEEMDWIIAHMNAVTRDICRIRAGASAGRRVVRFTQTMGGKDTEFVATDMSSGTLHSLGVLVALRQKPAPSLVFIDEIEASIHTAALSSLMNAAKATSTDHCQVVVSSHSTDALSHETVNADNVRIVDWQSDRSYVFGIGEGTRELLEPPETVGRLLRSNSLWKEDQPSEVIGDLFQVGTDDGKD